MTKGLLIVCTGEGKGKTTSALGMALRAAGRDPAQHVVITGRYAPEPLIAAADLVTEMRVLKHPLKSGIKAQKGIEF